VGVGEGYQAGGGMLKRRRGKRRGLAVGRVGGVEDTGRVAGRGNGGVAGGREGRARDRGGNGGGGWGLGRGGRGRKWGDRGVRDDVAGR